MTENEEVGDGMEATSCVDPEQGKWILHYELGELGEAEHERFVDHLLQCPHCHDEVYSLEPFTAAMRRARHAERRPVRWTSPRRLAWAATAVLVLAIAGAWWSWRQNPPGATPTPVAAAELAPWVAALEVPKAPYVESSEQIVLRSAGSSRAFRRAMTAYQADDFATAAERLEVVNRLEPEDSEAWFYRGVALLLDGDAEAAAVALAEAVRHGSPARRQSSRYYLALASLRRGRYQAARAELAAVAGGAGDEARAAADLVRRVDAEIAADDPAAP